MGSLVAIDAHAAEDALLPAFRRPGLGAVFRGSARRLFGRFFALVNLYALALSFLVLLILLPIGLVVLAATGERGGFVVGGLRALPSLPAARHRRVRRIARALSRLVPSRRERRRRCARSRRAGGVPHTHLAFAGRAALSADPRGRLRLGIRVPRPALRPFIFRGAFPRPVLRGNGPPRRGPDARELRLRSRRDRRVRLALAGGERTEAFRPSPRRRTATLLPLLV